MYACVYASMSVGMDICMHVGMQVCRHVYVGMYTCGYVFIARMYISVI